VGIFLLATKSAPVKMMGEKNTYLYFDRNFRDFLNFFLPERSEGITFRLKISAKERKRPPREARKEKSGCTVQEKNLPEKQFIFPPFRPSFKMPTKIRAR
jgi:hypothetical protein